ncbi:hypothetical protein Pyn_37587 [Prunus yedoensis var. nudiflora]|uniref:Uncharacterized protein n=1 Tax=Prunus yedoensis var. nudiflora TaxID=2094558 RepID=A0A314XZC7_PRUYE|nr:hypothetical protein Pyn_37587 [Prunus yedoensis var. nudiflora]
MHVFLWFVLDSSSLSPFLEYRPETIFAMTPKKLKTTKVSTGIPDWISEQVAVKHANEFQSALAQEQSNTSAKAYSPFPLSLRGPFKTPFLRPHYHQAKPEGLLSLDT